VKVLVATEKTQGARENDFCFVPEGEMVTFGYECEGEATDGPCGCRRSLVGVECRKATTTMRVLDLAITRSKLEETCRHSLKQGGFGDDPELAADCADCLILIARQFEDGAVIERRSDVFQEREV